MRIGDRLQRLISIGGAPLAGSYPKMERLPHGLEALLGMKNGFFAFESALHVLASGPVSNEAMSVQMWNDMDLWRSSYCGMADDLFFFAEDIFGGQFAFGRQGVVSFDPETGAHEWIASDLEGWADRVLADYNHLTGYPIAHSWQEVNGYLPVGKRLIPKRPFVLGGEFVTENLYPLDAAKGMRLRGELATQIRDLPEGQAVSFKLVD